MKKIIFSILCIIFSIDMVQAKDVTEVYVFYGEGCPHCQEEKRFLSKIEDKYENVNFNYIEVWNNQKHNELLQNVKKSYHIDSQGVPVTIIGPYYASGYTYNMEAMFERIIKQCQKEKCIDYVNDIQEKGIQEVSQAQLLHVTKEDRLQNAINASFLDSNNLIFIGVVLFSILLVISISIIRKTKKFIKKH